MTSTIARIYPHGDEPDADPKRDLVRELLVIGRERVAKPGGWSQDGLINHSTGAVNIIGAIIVSDRQPWFNLIVQDFALRALFFTLPFGWRKGRIYYNTRDVLAHYNNVPWRRQERIVELFDQAIRSRDND